MNASQDDEEGMGGEVHMDPVVYWTSSKDGLGMEELLMSLEMNMMSAEGDFDDDDNDDDVFVNDDDYDELEDDDSSRK